MILRLIICYWIGCLTLYGGEEIPVEPSMDCNNLLPLKLPPKQTKNPPKENKDNVSPESNNNKKSDDTYPVTSLYFDN